MKTNGNTEPDKFPGVLENPAGYRKSSDDYAVTIAVPISSVERLQPLMQKAGRTFVVYLVQVGDLAEAAQVLAANEECLPSPSALSPEGRGDRTPGLASVETLADWLCMQERNVQVLETKGIVFKDGRGKYRLKESVQGYIRELHSKGDGKNSDYNRERTEIMRINRMEKERMHLENMGKLVRYDALLAEREKKNADIKQKLIAMSEKTLPARLNLTPEQAVKLKNATRKLLAEFALSDGPALHHRRSGQDVPAAGGPDGKPVGGRKKKTGKQDKR